MKTAMIMAGGAGTRMHQSGSTLPKPLVEVAGVTLLERNLQQLLRFGFDTVYISVSSNSKLIREFTNNRLMPIAELAGISIQEVCETNPLGNIGAAGLVHGQCDSLLVVYADNLTTLDLSAVWRSHHETDPDITLATHHQTFQMPFGEVAICNETSEVSAYTEKPEYSIPVCSAISVLGPWALSVLASRSPMGISDLTRLAIRQQKQVYAFQHQAPWIDVNDLSERHRALKLVAEHFDQFENWWAGPARSVYIQYVLEPEKRLLNTGTEITRTLSWADIDAGEMLQITVSGAEYVDDTESVSAPSRAIEAPVMTRLASLYSMGRPPVQHGGEA